MIYSIWNPTRHVYTYYQGPALPYGDVPTPRHLRPSALGVAPDDAGWPLPAGAKPIGEGREARGMIASLGSSAAPSGSGLLVIVGLVVAAYGLHKVLR